MLRGTAEIDSENVLLLEVPLASVTWIFGANGAPGGDETVGVPE
jgi:hypothetical protein